MTPAERVVRRFLAFKYKPKESKRSKVDRLSKMIREKTGISKKVAEDIADAVIRKRDLPRLALQKGWPMKEDVVEGPKGSVTTKELQDALDPIESE